MTLPASPPISVSQINVELGRAAGAAFSIQGAAERGLAGVPSGPISFSDFLGKSSIIADYQGLFSGSGGQVTTVPGVAFGGATGTRRVFATISVSGFAASPRSISQVTIGGVVAAVHTQGNDRNTSTNAIWILAIASAVVPSGSSGDVVVTMSGVPTTTFGVVLGSYRALTLTGGIHAAGMTFPPGGGNSASFGLSKPSNALVLVCALQRDGGGLDITNPVTAEDYDTNSTAGLHLTGQASGTQTCAVSAPGAGTCAVAAVSWQHT